MRMSCNGCRVLRKGCGRTCRIRPCLQWIKTPASQSNATLFLAKFYGRAGLLNLLIAAPDHLRPDVFKSLLYEACGRTASPLYGSTGLLWSGNWQRCQNAVDAVFRGAPISPAADSLPIRSDRGFDIGWEDVDREKFGDLLRVRNRIRFKRNKASGGVREDVNRSGSHESSSHHQAPPIDVAPENRREFGSSKSIGIDQTEPELRRASCDVKIIGLDLTLGLAPKYT